MRFLVLWTTCLVTLAGCPAKDPCNPNPCGAGQACQASLDMCQSREGYYRERFLSCFNDKAFCSGRRQSCESFCADWMGCSGSLDVDASGVGKVSGTAEPEPLCVGASPGDGDSSTVDGGGSPSAACLGLDDAGTEVSHEATVVTVPAALAPGERVRLTYDYLGTATNTPYRLTAYWADGTDAGVSDAGDPRVIAWEVRADGQTEAAAPAGASGITLVCAADCHLGWNVTFACLAP